MLRGRELKNTSSSDEVDDIYTSIYGKATQFLIVLSTLSEKRVTTSLGVSVMAAFSEEMTFVVGLTG